MRPLKSLLGAVVASAVAGGLWAGPALAAQVTGAVTATDAVVAASGADEDGADLLGPGLLGLDTEMVTAMTQADPDLAARVSSGLRSADPYVVEATVAEISAHLTRQIGADHELVHLVTPGSVSPGPVRPEDNRIGIAVYISDNSQRLQGAALLAQGLEREQLVSAIHTALSKE